MADKTEMNIKVFDVSRVLLYYFHTGGLFYLNFSIKDSIQIIMWST